MDYPAIYILLTTYRRTDIALRTIRSLRQNLIYPPENYGWMVVDDGSGGGHMQRLLAELGETQIVYAYDSQRKGVGHGMNAGLHKIGDIGASLVLMMEDDWELTRPLDVKRYADTLMNHEEHGLIRFGYLAPDLLGYLISEENTLYWRLDNNGTTYRYAGHPSLRHLRFHEVYGWFDEGLAPGMTELSMCGKTNSKKGPNILYPAECGQWGFFAHLGAESLADVQPGR